MQTIRYIFADGTISEVEVSDELYILHLQLLQQEKRNHWKETRRRGAVSAPVIQMAVGTYPPGEISDVVVNAVFAAVKCVSAISQFVRAIAYKDPVTRGLRNITLVTALMSVLTLQVSIIAAFEAGDSLWESIASVGAVISLIIITTGIISVTVNALALKNLYSSENSGSSDGNGGHDGEKR